MLAGITLIWAIFIFILSIILIISIITTAQSNVRMREAVEKIHKEIYKANVVNGVHDKWEQLERDVKELAVKKVGKKGWF